MATCAEVRPIDAVIPYLLNNKTHKEDAIDRIASSIREFGWTYPLLIDENNSLLAGHKRLAAARKLGLAEVPVLVKSGLSEAQKKAYRIIDNKSSEESEWNLDNLKLDLDDLAAAEFDIEQFVLNDFDFGKDDEEVVEDDHVSAPATASLIKLGDVIQLGPHRLVCGDSTDPKVVAQLFEGGGCTCAYGY